MSSKNTERQFMEWSAEEIEALRTLYAKGLSDEQIAKVLKRTVRGVNSRLSIERIKPTKAPAKTSVESFKRLGLDNFVNGNGHLEETSTDTPVVVTQIAHEQAKLPIPPSEDESLRLLLDFVAMAWREGHSITIASLGATFQKAEELS